MQPFDDWQLTSMIVQMMSVTRNVALIIIGAFLALRVLIEIYKVMVVENFRFSIGQFVPMLILTIAILAYGEIMPWIGDGFYAMGNAIRGEGETTFSMDNLWLAIKDELALDENGDISFWDVVQSLGGFFGNPWDMLQNVFGISNAVTWQLLGLLFRWGMIFFKNIVYCQSFALPVMPL
jgi:hypothetical protein